MSYIGKAPGFGIRNRYYYTATSSQTLFSGADDNGQTLAYADSKYLDVYLNGVLLVAGTDYTATTLTSVTLTSGAAASDIVEIVAYDIFSVADTVSASNGGTFDGAVTFADSITVDNDGGVVAYFNRATTDGAIAIFQKDGSNVGVIGSADSGDRVYLANGGLEGVGVDNGSNALLPTSQVGADKDNHLDLGTSSSRFKDLYLSGGVYLGGTGAANYIEDYEEGTFTAVLGDGTSTADSSTYAYYTKVGNKVTIQVRFDNAGFSGLNTANALLLTNLPFTTASTGFFALNIMTKNYNGSETAIIFRTDPNTTLAALLPIAQSGGGFVNIPISDFGTTPDFNVSGTYITA